MSWGGNSQWNSEREKGQSAEEWKGEATLNRGFILMFLGSEKDVVGLSK